MKFKLVIIFLLSFLMGCNDKATMTKESEKQDAPQSHPSHSYYTCTMHPQVHEDKPGNCPICGMPLVKVLGVEKSSSEKNSLLPSDYQKKVIGLTQGKAQKRTVSFEIQSSGRLISTRQVAFYIYESDILHVKIGQKFEGSCSSMSGEVLNGEIIQIDTIADPASRSVRVIGNITSTHHLKLVEGSFFAKIKSKPTEALLVPYDAVLRTGKENIVYKVSSDGRLHPTKVVLGRTLDDEIEVINGLEEDDTISLGPNFLIDSEARLKGMGTGGMEGMEGM